MLRLKAKISHPNFTLSQLTEVSVESSYETLTDTCRITLPRKLTFKSEDDELLANDVIKRGDEMSIELSYHNYPQDVFKFTGFVRSITPSVPLVIELEDHAFLLKKGPQNYSLREAKLDDIISRFGRTVYEAVDAELGQFRVSNATPAQVLKELQEAYGIPAWFRDGILYVGLAWWPEQQNTVKLNMAKNVFDSSSLEWQNKDDLSIKVRAISTLPDNSKLEVEVGDPDGEESRTLNFYNIKSESELKARAEEELKRFRFDGYTGTLTLLGVPIVKHGDIVNITDPDYPDRGGEYVVKTVTTTYGLDGYKQEIELDGRIA